MAERGSILVVGGGNLERAPDGRWTTKAPIASYLHGLADHFGQCVWIVQASGTWNIELAAPTTAVTGLLDEQKVRAVPMEGRLNHTLRNSLLALRHLCHCRYAIFFLPASLTMVAALPFARLRTRRMAVYLAGDFEAPLTGEVDGHRTMRGRIYRTTFRIALRLAHVVIARGRFLAEVAGRFNNRVVETVPLGHMTAELSTEPDTLASDTPRRMLYMGLLLEAKGLGDLLHAMRIVVDRRPDVSIRLDVLGEGPDRSQFEALASELGLSDRVPFHGWVEDAESIDAFLSESHVVVMPSSTHPEGVPRVIDEALIRRVPVVATRVAGVPDEFRDGEVVLVDPAARDQLADALEQLLFDPAIRKRALVGAERRIRHWQGVTSAADQHARILRGELPVAP